MHMDAACLKEALMNTKQSRLQSLKLHVLVLDYDYAYNLMQMCLSIFCLQMNWKW